MPKKRILLMLLAFPAFGILMVLGSCASYLEVIRLIRNAPPAVLSKVTVTDIMDSSIEVPVYITRTLYVYTLKGELMPRTTYDRSEVPWHTELQERNPPKFGYGNYSAVIYEEVHQRVHDGTRTEHGFDCLFDNFQSLFLTRTEFDTLAIKDGSLVEYRGILRYADIESVDGRIINSQLRKYLAKYEKKSEAELVRIREKNKGYKQIAADRILSQRGFFD